MVANIAEKTKVAFSCKYCNRNIWYMYETTATVSF